MDPSTITLPPRAQLGAFVRERLSTVEAALPFLDMPATEVHALARTSGAVLAPEVCGATWLRVGDAAMAADPLSGNGIFQSLSSALQAPMVVHTLLNHPADAPHAQRFHTERVQGLFQRFARIGRDFYAQEARWAGQPFWSARRAWPDALPAHGAEGHAPPHIEQRRVVDRDRIRLAEVLVTADQPLGIWHVDGVEVAPERDQVLSPPIDLLRPLDHAGRHVPLLVCQPVSRVSPDRPVTDALAPCPARSLALDQRPRGPARVVRCSCLQLPHLPPIRSCCPC